jgi:ABC-2 type transport system ATP-binding protein
MDEPFTGLDPVSLFNLKQIIRNNREKKIGCLISSHMLDIAEKLADDLIFIKGGRALYSGVFDDLKKTWPDSGSLDELFLKLNNTGLNAKSG